MRTTTKKDYTTIAFGYKIHVPAGSPVTSITACGHDPAYHFLENVRRIAKRLTGFDDSILLHDLTYYGLNIPAEFCNPYPEN